ncbi:MAG: patatin-like phospholipase family protein [Pedobacter sp.]
MENKDKQFTFHAGICMAGAISAGAYTAGVMDYLLETLEHWEKAKALQAAGKLSGIPRHNFSIEVLGGASAGGMTAAVTAAGVQSEFPPVTQSHQDDLQYTTKNPLYNSWVNLTETDKEDMISLMLNTTDIESDETNSNKEVRAGLNSKFIEQIAQGLTDTRAEKRYDRKYIANDLDVFTTVTNLRGFHYKVTFNTSSGRREHRMKMHKDYAFFKLSDTEYGNDGRIPVNFNLPDGLNTDVLADAAMSTGAFPIGLESRLLKRRIQYINDNKFLNLRLTDPHATALHEKTVEYDVLSPEDFVSLNVDGGIINNEPYEITQQLLDDRRRTMIKSSTENTDTKTFEDLEAEAAAYVPKTKACEFDSLVLMIDPFPNDDEVDSEEFAPKKAWRHIIPSILSAMRGQLMMKDDQIRRAYLSEDYTRFLIMPSRTQKSETQTYPLACGSLGGFGGFFSKGFRKHDFYLGRRNCQRFLQKHFSAPTEANNAILAFGYEGVTNYRYMEGGKESLPIIPDLRLEKTGENGDYKVIETPTEEEYAYPTIKLSYILGLEEKVKKRIKCILDHVKNPIDLEKKESSPILTRIRQRSFFQRLGDSAKGKAANWYIDFGKSQGKGVIATACIDAIIRDMEKRGQISDDLLK